MLLVQHLGREIMGHDLPLFSPYWVRRREGHVIAFGE